MELIKTSDEQFIEYLWYKNKCYKCIFKLSKTDEEHAYAILFDGIMLDGNKMLTVRATKLMANNKEFVGLLQEQFNRHLKDFANENKK